MKGKVLNKKEMQKEINPSAFPILPGEKIIDIPAEEEYPRMEVYFKINPEGKKVEITRNIETGEKTFNIIEE